MYKLVEIASSHMRCEALNTNSYLAARLPIAIGTREGDIGAGPDSYRERSRRQRVFGYFWLSKSDKK